MVAIHSYNFPYLPNVLTNEMARVYLTIAIVERGALDIDVEMRRFGPTIDTVVVEGRTFSNKAPGTSLLGVPVYALLRGFDSLYLRTAMFWLRFLTVTIPCLLLLIPFARCLKRVAPDDAPWRAAVAGAALGTLALPYAILFMGHQLAAAFIAAALALLCDDEPRRPIAAGLLSGAAVAIDYQSALAAAALGIYALHRSRRAGTRFALGTLPATGVLALYHTAAFGAPWKTAYAFLGPELASMWWDVSPWPQTHKLVHSLVAPNHGLLAFSPWLGLALPGFVLLWREKRALTTLCAAVAAAYVYFGASFAPWTTGWDAGPRYLACMVPFLALPAARALSWAWSTPWRGPALGLVGASVIVHTLMIAVLPYYPPSYTNPFFDVTVAYLWHGFVAYNAGHLVGLKGLVSVVPYLIGVTILVGAILFAPPRRAYGLGAVLVMALHLGGLGLVEHRWLPNTHINMMRHWEPRPR